MPQGAEIVAAMDADEDGRKLAAVVNRAFEPSRRGDLRFVVHEPFGCNDWNEQLQLRAKPEPSFPRHPEEPSVA